VQLIEDSAESDAWRVIAGEFTRLLVTERRPDSAYLYGKSIAFKFEYDNPSALNEIAWAIVDPDNAVPAEHADLGFALECAQRATELADERSRWMILDTLARVIYRQGDTVKAIEIQRQAMDATRRPERRRELEVVLREYEAALTKNPKPADAPK
jgi:hypothetical protein